MAGKNAFYSSRWVDDNLVVAIAGITEEITFVRADMHDEVIESAFRYGLDVRANRMTAIEIENGHRATPAERHARVKRLATHYNSGVSSWSMKAESEAKWVPTIADIIEAMHRYYVAEGKPERDTAWCTKAYATLTEATRVQLPVSTQLFPHLVAIRAEQRRRPGGDASEILDGLMSEA